MRILFWRLLFLPLLTPQALPCECTHVFGTILHGITWIIHKEPESLTFFSCQHLWKIKIRTFQFPSAVCSPNACTGSSLPTLGSQSHSLKLTPYHFSVFPMALLVRHPRFLFYTRSSLTLLLLFNIVKLSFLSNTWKKSVRSCGCLSNRGILFNTCVMNQN